MPDCDEGQLDGVNGPLHLLLPVEEHKDDHIYKMFSISLKLIGATSEDPRIDKTRRLAKYLCAGPSQQRDQY